MTWLYWIGWTFIVCAWMITMVGLRKRRSEFLFWSVILVMIGWGFTYYSLTLGREN